MKTARRATIDLTVSELSAGGDGVGIHELEGERRAVFVPNVVTGERVRVEVDDLKKRPLRGRLLEILSPSPARVPAPCPHAERCGGCDWMHLHPDEQLAEHRRIVARLLGVDVAVVVSHAPARAVGYRTRARVHISAKREIIAGMYARRSHEPAEVDACVVLHPVIERARLEIAEWLAGSKGRGEARLSLGDPRAPERRAVLDLTWRGDLVPEVFGRLERAITRGDVLAGARVFAGEVKTPARIGDPTPYLIGADGSPLRLGPGGFSQATEEGNLVLARRADELLARVADGPCVELYAGAGNLTVLFARCRDVIAVEQDEDAVRAATENLRARGLSRARILHRSAGDFPIPKGTRAVVLDPPREGAREVVAALVANARGAARRGRDPDVIYISCDPPTLARDVAELVRAGWRREAIETFEMFPQTSHVETIVTLTPA